jgi:tetratricopeptide (TPR) repeat protein
METISTCLLVVRSFLAGLIRRLRQKQLPPAAARAALPPADHPFLSSYLDAVIRAREAGDAELSLRLITTAKEAGIQSPWLRDNEARAQLCLGRKAEAFSIWQELETSSDKGVSRLAGELIQAQRRDALEQLKKTCLDALWAPSYLSELEPDGDGLKSFDMAVLNEVIASRKAGHPELSLQLIEKGRELGVGSPWLRDNEARALVNLGRRSDALAIWEELENHPDNAVASQARQMSLEHQELLDLEEQQTQRAVLASLQEICLEAGWSPLHLEACTATEGAAIERMFLEASLLKDVIASREAGHPELSLQLIEKGRELGVGSPWLRDNEARALVNLGRRSDALTIWKELENHPDDAVASQARRMSLQQQELLDLDHQQAQQAGLASLQEICLEAGWSPLHLEDIPNIKGEPLKMDVLEANLLKEVIACREAGHPELSLQMIKKGRELGVGSPWLRDNEARALVNLNRRAEALSIWQELQAGPIEALASSSTKLVEKQKLVLFQETVLEEADLLMMRGEPQAAVNRLVNALIECPEYPPFHEKLRAAVSMISPDSNVDTHRQFDESINDFLMEKVLQLRIYESFLSGIEERLKTG